MYQAYNKEHDPYTHTLHPHQVFNSHFFEVSQQAKEEQQKEEIEQMRHQLAYPVIFDTQGARPGGAGGPTGGPTDEAFANRILRMQEGSAAATGQTSAGATPGQP